MRVPAWLPTSVLVAIVVYCVVQVLITAVYLVTGADWVMMLFFMNLVVYLVVVYLLAARDRRRRRQEAEEFLRASGLRDRIHSRGWMEAEGPEDDS